MNEADLKNFSIHTINFALATITRALQAIGQIQVNTELTDEQKQAQINPNYALILNLGHMVVPFIGIAEDLFPQYKGVLDWLSKAYTEVQSQGLIKACECAGCIKPTN